MKSTHSVATIQMVLYEIWIIVFENYLNGSPCIHSNTVNKKKTLFQMPSFT